MILIQLFDKTHILYWKEIFDKNHIKFVSEREFISEDVIFDIDFLSKSNCVVAITDYVYYYCVNPNSLSKTFRTDRFAKVKKMYFEVIRKLKELYPKDEYELRTDRFLIARARTNIRQIVKHKSVIGKEETKKAKVSQKSIHHSNKVSKNLLIET